MQDYYYTFVTSFLALFPVMNPVSSGLIINTFLDKIDDAQRRVYNRKIVLNAFLIGIGSMAVGHLVLTVFGLAVAVIQIGGGILICKTGWESLSDAAMRRNAADKEETLGRLDPNDIGNRIFYPISFPISIGPGTISVIFTLMAASGPKGNLLGNGIHYAVIVLVLAVLCTILYVLLSQERRITRRLGDSGNLVLNKLIAFITFCIGLQIILNGMANTFHVQIL